MLETNQYFKGEKGLELTNVEWLLDHHKTKLQERRKTVDEENLKKDPLSDIIEFRKDDFYDASFDNDTFDLTFFGNCFAYVTDYFKIIEEMKRVTKNGGRIAAKDFDGGLFIVHPIEPQLSLKILAAAAQALKENPLEPPFDNFTGRKLHGLFLQAGLK